MTRSLAPRIWLAAMLVALGCGDGTAPKDEFLRVTSLSAGSYHTCALDTDGAAWCWGFGRNGELGVDTTSLLSLTGGGFVATQPMRVKGDMRFTSIAAGDGFTCALTTGGAAYCWGSNEGGRLGHAPTGGACRSPCSTTPVPVDGGHVFASLSASYIACGIEAAGRMFCWGGAPVVSALLGPASSRPDFSQVPVEITPEDGSVVAWASMSASFSNACATTTTRRVACWGSNAFGGLGIGDTVRREVAQPRFVATPIALRGATVRMFGACAIDDDYRGMCWGNNAGGVLGTGEPGPANGTPVRVATDIRFKSMAAGTSNVCAITADGNPYCWGTIGVPGGQGLITTAVPTRLSTTVQLASVSSSGQHTCGIGVDGRAYCWGLNEYGQAAPSTVGYVALPSPIRRPP